MQVQRVSVTDSATQPAVLVRAASVVRRDCRAARIRNVTYWAILQFAFCSSTTLPCPGPALLTSPPTGVRLFSGDLAGGRAGNSINGIEPYVIACLLHKLLFSHRIHVLPRTAVSCPVTVD